jgi:ADP-ribose pyrophosphatase
LLLELPAGVMDPGEQPLESARRELREETGMDSAELLALGGFFMVAGYSNEYMHAFLALGLRGSAFGPG